MKILWESSEWPGARIEPAITYLSWIPQPGASGTAQHGYLGVGSDSGAVGITLTDLVPTEDDNSRYNFNLRGHNSAICMVTWNQPQGKLASCDASGVIYVWVRNEERWSVELVNDRGVKVRDLSWSPCGSAALICYEDNFVLIGSATGQRVWSTSFPSRSTVTSGVWAPDSKHLVIGFSTGTIQVLTDQGANVTERSFSSTDVGIVSMAFSPEINDRWTLALQTELGDIMMINSFDQIDPYVITGLPQLSNMQWNADGTLLAVLCNGKELLLLDTEARCVHRERMSIATDERSLTAMTWAHGGRAIIVAAGGQLAVGKVLFGVPSLFQLVSYDLWRLIGHSSRRVDKLPLPLRERASIRQLDHHIIRCRIPKVDDLCSYVCTANEARCYCTIRPVNRTTFVLCIEHMGGLVPVLIGRQVNRFLPLFHISLHPSSTPRPTPMPGSCAQVEDVSNLSRTSTGRTSLWRRSKRHIRALMSRHVRPQRQDHRLVQVSSNVWCTRFNISSLTSKYLPEFLGQVVYKTSVLHLQPRQMTIDLALLSNTLTSKHFNSRRQSACPTPSPSETESEDTRPLLRGDEEGLTCEERAFFEKVVHECASLRAAMTNTGLDASTTTSAPMTNQGTSQVSAIKESPARVESRQGEADLNLSIASTWHEEIDTLEFIDGADDHDPLLPSTSSAPEPVSEAPPIEAFRKDLQLDLDRLIRIANQLSARYDFNMKRDRASIDKMQMQMKDLLKKVNQIEKKVSNDDVRVEVRHLMRTLKDMKKALGDNRPPPVSQYNLLTMHNKTPFWNEHNQVYQLDFGGRVTQESAKNFQVELDNTQVLQFGRIDGGYTLDFRKPFSACQAFAVALASITQRLK